MCKSHPPEDKPREKHNANGEDAFPNYADLADILEITEERYDEHEQE